MPHGSRGICSWSTADRRWGRHSRSNPRDRRTRTPPNYVARLGHRRLLGRRNHRHRVEPEPDGPVAAHQRQPFVTSDIDPDLTTADIYPDLCRGALEDHAVDRAVEHVGEPSTVAILDDLDVFGADVGDDRLADCETWACRAADGVAERLDQPAGIVTIAVPTRDHPAQTVVRTDELRHIRGFRLEVDVGLRTDLLDAAAVHHHDPIRDR